MKKTLLILPCLILSACGSAPSSSTSASTATGTYTVTCPSGTSLVQNTTCEETTVHTATTQLAAEGFCAQAERHLCSIAERVGQFSKAPQEVVATSYWLSDFESGDGFTVNDGQATAVAGGSYAYFCCVTGTVSL